MSICSCMKLFLMGAMHDETALGCMSLIMEVRNTSYLFNSKSFENQNSQNSLNENSILVFSIRNHTDKIISVDPSLPNSIYFSQHFYNLGYKSIIALSESDVFITNLQSLQNNHNTSIFIKNLLRLDRVKEVSNIGNYETECVIKNTRSIEIKTYEVIIPISIILIGIAYYIYSIFALSNIKFPIWYMSQPDQIAPPQYSKNIPNLNRILKNNYRRSTRWNHIVVEILSVRRNNGPLLYEKLLSIPINNDTSLNFIVSDLLSNDKSINVNYKLISNDPHSVFDNQKIVYTSNRDLNPLMLTYCKQNAVCFEVTLPADILIAFAPMGRLGAAYISCFVEIMQLIEIDPFVYTNFEKVTKSVAKHLGLCFVAFWQDRELIMEYGEDALDENVLESISEMANFEENTFYDYNIYSAYSGLIVTKAQTIQFLVIFPSEIKTEPLVEIGLPTLIKACAFGFCLSNSQERNLQFNRFIDVIGISRPFTLMEVIEKDQIIYETSTIKNAKQPIVDFLAEHPNEKFGSYAMYREDSEHPWLSVTFVRSSDGITTVLAQDVSSEKRSEDDLSDALADLQLAMKALDMMKFTVQSGHVMMETDELFDKLGLNQGQNNLGLASIHKSRTSANFKINDRYESRSSNTDQMADLEAEYEADCDGFVRTRASKKEIKNDRDLMRAVFEADKAKLGDVVRTHRVTIRLLAANGKIEWYSVVSDGSIGYVFNVNELVELKNRIQTTGKGLALASLATSLIFWSVELSTDSVKTLLGQPTIWDALSIDRNTPFRKLEEFLHEDDRPFFVEALNAIKNGEKEEWSGDVRLLRIGISYEWHRIILARSEGGMLHCLAVNIHTSKMNELELIETQRLRDILLSSGKLILWEFKDNDEEFDDPPDFNRNISLERFSSTSSIDANGVGCSTTWLRMNWRFVDEFIAADEREEFKARIRKCFDEEGFFDMNVTLILPENELCVSARGSCRSDKTIAGVCIDITELSNTVKALEIETKRAAEANKAKTVFLANMSHEIRTPMNGIFGVLDVIASQDLTMEQRVLVDSIRSSSFQLMNLLDDTLHLSKIETGQIEVSEGNFRFNRIIEPIVIGAASRARMNGIGFRLRIDKGFPAAAYGDSQLLTQIINNILSNSLKFTKTGHIGVHLKWTYGDKEWLEVVCNDTGIGMTEKQQRVIFERFAQADNTVQRKFGGTGLGLSLVQDIVTMLGGTLNLESAPGKGSKFTVRLPMQSTYQSYAPPFPGGEMRAVLVSITDEISKLTITDWAEQVHYEVIPFRMIDDALGLIQSRRVDCIFIEDQEDICRRLKDILNKKKARPLLCAISHPEAPTVMDMKLSKPVMPHHILNVLSKARYRQRPQLKLSRNNSTAEMSEGDREKIRAQAKVLVVEDNKTNQFVMKKLLGKIGVKFSIADNGLAAIEQLHNDQFDLVFMDCQMPVLDGISTTKRIRASNDRFRDIPIVALTASAIEGDEETCYAAGMDAYLAKPVRIQQITNAIDRFTK